MNKNRLEAFSDGVFAIAVTLLVLDVHLPNMKAVSSRDLDRQLLSLWPEYVSYVTSFLLIGIYWINHHSIFHYVKSIDRSIVWRNLVFLMLVAFLPFPTAVVARYPDVPAAVMFYGIMLLITALWVNFAWWYMVRGGFIDPQMTSPAQLRRASIRYAVGGIICLAAIAVGPFAPAVSIALYFVLAVFYLFPGGLEQKVIVAESEQK